MTDHTESQEQNHISAVRQHLLDQMKALRGAASPEAIERELGRSRGVSDLAQAIVNTAKVEVDYLKVTGQTGSTFLEGDRQPALPDTTAAGNKVTQLPGPGNGITSITKHTLR